MKRLILVGLLLAAFSSTSYAVDGKAVLYGFGIGLTVQIIPWTRNHVVMPPVNLAKKTAKKAKAKYEARKARAKVQRQ